jgi:hypothetical protein
LYPTARELLYYQQKHSDVLNKVDLEYQVILATDSLTRNFNSWNITRQGIRFNFDACKVIGCAGGEQTVEVPFSASSSILSPRGVDFADLVRR